MANGYSCDSTQRELSNEYQHNRVKMIFIVFKKNCAFDESSLSIGRVKPADMAQQSNVLSTDCIHWAEFTVKISLEACHRVIGDLLFASLHYHSLTSHWFRMKNDDEQIFISSPTIRTIADQH